jgi:hypothetical protein
VRGVECEVVKVGMSSEHDVSMYYQQALHRPNDTVRGVLQLE